MESSWIRLCLVRTVTKFSRDGNVVEYRQEAIPESKYHTQLKAAEGTDESAENIATSSIRYWSDYSLVDLHPRSLQRLPDVPEWEDVNGDWVGGGEAFTKFDEVS